VALVPLEEVELETYLVEEEVAVYSAAVKKRGERRGRKKRDSGE
jgi:hypothetical protein